MTGNAIDDVADLIANAKRKIDDRKRAGTPGHRSGSSPPKAPSQATAAKTSSSKSSSVDSASPCSSSSVRSPTKSMKSPMKGSYSPEVEEMDLEESEGGGRGGGVRSEVIMAELVKDIERLKPVESVANEHKNFHATISKLAKAAEKVLRGAML